MELRVEREPCMLYETVELLYAFVNHIPAERLTAEGEYCVSEKELASMIGTVCAHMDSQDPDLGRYFARRPILDEPDQFTCLAFCMVYALVDMNTLDIAGQIDAMCARWERMRRGPFVIRAINRFTIDISEHPEGRPTFLAEELKKLPVEEDFCLTLLETFSDYTYQMERLRGMVEPVARELRPLLEPYVSRAQGLQQIWQEFFRKHTVEDFLTKRTGMMPEHPPECVGFVLRYLDAHSAVGHGYSEQDSLWMHLGVALLPTLQPGFEQGHLNEREFAAFHLLGDKSRSDMIQAVTNRAMSMRDLTAQLGLNPGTIFRNLNSLTNAGLLVKELRGDRYFYRANFSFIEALFQHMLDFYRQGESD